MAFPALLNFRSTAAYVTDGAGQTYAKSLLDLSAGDAETYPVTRDGITFGHAIVVLGLPTRDRSTTNDVRLAGMWFNGNNNTDDVRIDLPAAGTYDIGLACGEPNYQRTTTVKIYDNASLLHTVSGTTGGANNYLDANGNNHTAANWPANSTTKQLTFATTTMIVRVGDGAGTATGFLAHVSVTAAASTFVPYPRPRGLMGGHLRPNAGMQQ